MKSENAHKLHKKICKKTNDDSEIMLLPFDLIIVTNQLTLKLNHGQNGMNTTESKNRGNKYGVNTI